MSESIADVMEPVSGEPPKKPKGDLGVRTVSAVVMVAIAGVAFWTGGLPLLLFAAAICLGVAWEWFRIVSSMPLHVTFKAIWIGFGAIYIGLAYWSLLIFSQGLETQYGSDVTIIGTMVAIVVATDVGAYFTGRAIGGPKIATRISPSKTWSGLFGGMATAGIVSALLAGWVWDEGAGYFFYGCLMAVVAQAGDFFQSWMKRRAGVKDSGSLIPGHGGIFDRVDGLLAVLFVHGVLLGLPLLFDVSFRF